MLYFMLLCKATNKTQSKNFIEVYIIAILSRKKYGIKCTENTG